MVSLLTNIIQNSCIMALSIQKFSSQFPLLSQCVYANTGASGLLYDDLLEWRQEHDLDLLLQGSELFAERASILKQCKKALANFFTTTTQNVALIPNFSLGFNMVLDALPVAQNVLVIAEDYPSFKWPFLQRDYSVFEVAICVHIEEAIREAILKNKITVLAVSMVQWLSGVLLDVSFFKELKAEFPDLVIMVDGTQFCGTVPFNFDNSGIDVIGASGYKWLLGGYGNGFLLCSAEIQQKLKSPVMGYYSTNGDAVAATNGSVSFVKRIQPGHLDGMAFGSLLFSLRKLQEVGQEVIGEQLKELRDYALSEFSKLGLLTSLVLERKQHSTIFNLPLDKNVYAALNDAGVVCSQRGGGVRFSFHFYNTIEDIDAIVAILKSRV